MSFNWTISGYSVADDGAINGRFIVLIRPTSVTKTREVAASQGSRT